MTDPKDNGHTEGDSKCTAASEKIIKQIEYYFGDINLPRDKFLQEELKKDNGWVPISTMLKFNRLTKLTTDPNAVVTALRKSDLIELSNDDLKIRRNPEAPLPDDTLEYWQEIRKRTVFLKGIPETSTLDELQEFLKGYGTVQNIVMRTRKTEEGKRIYKGSSFITFSDVETAQKFASLSDLKFKEIALINKMQDNYVADKKEKRKDEKELKRKMKTELIKEQKKAFDQPHFVAGSVLKVIGFKGDETVDELKVFFQQFGGVAYVKQEKDGDENSIVYIRFVESKEAEAAAEKMNAKFENGKILYNEIELSVKVLEGEEEQKYWSEFGKQKMESSSKRGVKSKFNQREHAVRRRSKRHAEKDELCEVKAKRTVFKDDEAEFDNDVKDEVSAPGEIEPLKSEGIPLKDEVKNE